MAQSNEPHSAAAKMEIRNPGPLDPSGTLVGSLAALALLGVFIFVIGIGTHPDRVWASFVQNHFFFMSLGVGGLFFAGLHWLTNAMWSAAIRRLSEALTSYLPVALVLTFVLYFGIHQLYPWSHAQHVAGDAVLQGKSGYLNVSFFMIRNVIALGIWMLFANKLVGNSLAQDRTGAIELTRKNRSLVPAFMILFGISFTVASFDLMMSLDPHWFSTMFGVYCFAGLFYSTLAMTCLITVLLKSSGKLDGIVNENHLHDLGKYMFAFTVFWAYIGFSQFMLIWYANLPEETGYFIRRLDQGWYAVSVFLLVGKFVTPFLLMLPREVKRNSKFLAVMAVFMLLAQWIDVLWLVQPQFFPRGPIVGWIEIGIALGFLGLFGLAVVVFLKRNNVVAIGDPKLAQSVFHHHQ